jgi:deoxyribodipyrimidine photolyase-related protein
MPIGKRKTPPPESAPVRHLVVVLGDQLNRDASAWDGFDASCDRAWMAEVAEESTHVWSSRQRTALFLAAMRHFAHDLQRDGVRLHYRRLDDVGNLGSLSAELRAALTALKPQRVIVTEPGEWRVQRLLEAACNAEAVPLEVRADCHFLCSRPEFARHAKGRKQLRLEYFYREMRQRHGILMDGDMPCGAEWNYDADNREAFPADGPGFVPPPARFEPDAITQEVIALVQSYFAAHPGRLATFGWPVTRAQALQALERFITERIEHFGRYQDAMWIDEPWLYHSHVSAALNLKLLDPREVIAAVESAYRAGRAPLAAAEGFIRQVLGWREYVRGIYWLKMPQYLEGNALDAHEPLPAFYWTGQCEMLCLLEVIGQTLEHGYAHHIQRLMVTGLYALMLGVAPKEVHAWYLAVYVDAVEWVELPNVIGMSQHADGGLMASKPYIASGKYIDRMSNYCARCRFDPKKATGDDACPFTTLYWDFLARHEARLAKNPRMVMQVKNLARQTPAQRHAIAERAASIRRGEVCAGS